MSNIDDFAEEACRIYQRLLGVDLGWYMSKSLDGDPVPVTLDERWLEAAREAARKVFGDGWVSTAVTTNGLRHGKTAAMLLKCYERALRGELVSIATPKGVIRMELKPARRVGANPIGEGRKETEDPGAGEE
jgi:hypothetical protein